MTFSPRTSGAVAYGGTITLEQSDQPGTVILTQLPNVAVLGTGQIVVASPSAPGSLAPTINGTGAGATLDNPLSFQSAASLTVVGNVTFSAAATLDGMAGINTNSAGDQVSFTGDLQGTGGLTVDGPGTSFFTGAIASGVSLSVAGNAGTQGWVNIGADLQGGANQIMDDGQVQVWGVMEGGGGIDVDGGTFVTDETSGAGGSSTYTGTVVLEGDGIIKEYDDVDAFGLGKGTLDLKGGLLQNSSGSLAILSNPVTVEGPVTISSRGERLKLTQTVDLTGTGSLDVYGTLALVGPLDGSGTITLDGDLLAISTSNPDFTGNVVVNSGTVEVAQDDALGSGPLTADLAERGVLESVTDIGDPILDNPLTVEVGTLILQGQLTFPNGITVDSGATLEIEAAGSQIVISGPLTGGGNIVIGGGILSLPADMTSFTGNLEFQGGQATPTLTVSDAGCTYNGSRFPATFYVDGVAGGALDGISPTLTYYVGNTASGTGSATASVAAATYTVVANFAGDADYIATSSLPVTFVVNKATPIVTWANPANITAGTALSATQLDATANISGSFAYIPPAGTVLSAGQNQTLSAIFAPTDATDYNTASATAQINVITPATTATRLVFAQQPTSVIAGHNLCPAVMVYIENASGKIVTTDNTMVTLAIATGPSGATLGGTVSVAAVKGVATFKNLKLTMAGTYTLIATDSADKLTSVPSNKFAISPAQASKLVFIKQPTDVTAGNIISPAVSVAVEDQYGNIVTTGNSTVKLSLIGGSCGASLLGTANVQVYNGVAIFKGLSIIRTGQYSLKAMDCCLAGATSSTFKVTPGPAVQMRFVDQFSWVNSSGKIFRMQVALYDKYGNLATNDTSSVTLSLGAHPKNGVLTGILTAAVVNGIATFNDLSLNGDGRYSLVATDSNGIPSISSPLLCFGRDVFGRIWCDCGDQRYFLLG
jgi:hypothetical protein